MNTCPFISRVLAILLCSALCVLTQPQISLSQEIPKAGMILPEFSLIVPDNETDVQYLALTGKTEFQLADVPAAYLIIEIIGVYCPVCFQQAPSFNKLFKRIKRVKDGQKIKLLAIAVGGSQPEVSMLRQKGTYHFPIISDPDYRIHKLLGEPRTPMTFVVDAQGKIVSAHLGPIADIDAFFNVLNRLPDK